MLVGRGLEACGGKGLGWGWRHVGNVGKCRKYPRWMELLGSTAPIPANMLAERVGTKTESHGLETWPQPQKYSQSRKSTCMFPWLKTRGVRLPGILQLTCFKWLKPQAPEMQAPGFIAQWLETWDSSLGWCVCFPNVVGWKLWIWGQHRNIWNRVELWLKTVEPT